MRIIDISVPVYPGMRIHQGGRHDDYYGDPGYVEIINVRTPDMPGSRGGTARRISMLHHHGTHVDAPEHQVPGGKMIGDYPVDRFVGNGLLVDMAKGEGDGDVAVSELSEWLDNKLGGVDMLLFKNVAEGTSGRRGLSSDCYKWLANKGIKLLNGPEATSKTPGQGAYPNMFLSDILNLHNVENLDQIRKERFKMYVLPIKLTPAEASPARAIVVEED